MHKKILFITGTRADFGKLKPLMHAVERTGDFSCHVFVTGMHTLSRYGYTVKEVEKSGFQNIHVFMNQLYGEPMDLVLANTISGVSRYMHEIKPDLIVVHGDRVETLAGAIVGALNNIYVAHIEGGEVSGTIDELLRHATSKLAHIHFVANDEARRRILRLGEQPDSIFIIGSPDVDIMLSGLLPTLEEVKSHYMIPFERYAIVIFHPVTTEYELGKKQAEELVAAVKAADMNFIVIYPNNDTGSHFILEAYEELRNKKNVKIYPSLRFEYFLTLLQHADCIIGNSSAGVREAPVYAVPTVNIGSRQDKRFRYPSIVDCVAKREEILWAIEKAKTLQGMEPCLHFGQGNSAELFIQALSSERLWRISKQKRFYEKEGE